MTERELRRALRVLTDAPNGAWGKPLVRDWMLTETGPEETT